MNRTMTGGRTDAAMARHAGTREQLAFNYGQTVPSRGLAEQAIAAHRDASFGVVSIAEPRDWGYLGLLAFTAVLLLRPQDQIPGLGALHLAEVCAIAGIAPMLLHRLARRLPAFRVTAETAGLLALGAAILMTAPFSIWPGGAIGVFTDAFFKVLIVFVLMTNTLTTPKRLEHITGLIVLCCGYIAALALFNYARGLNLVEGNRLNGPVSGIFGNPNDLAMNMVTFLPAAAVVAISPTGAPLKRLAAAGISLLMLATIVFTQSRGGLVGLVAMFATLVLLGRKVRPGFGVMVVIAVLAAAPFAPSSFWERMWSIVDSKQDQREFTGSREARRIVMEEGIKAFVANPITGVGAGQFPNYNPPGRRERWRETHNAIIQVAAETGIVGLLAFCFLIWRAGWATVVTRRLLRRPRRGADVLQSTLSDQERTSLTSHSVAMTAGLVGWFVCALFASVAYSWTFYYVLALIVSNRNLVQERVDTARAFATSGAKGFSVPRARSTRAARSNAA